MNERIKMKFTANVTNLLRAISPAVEVATNQKSGDKEFIGYGKIHLVANKEKQEVQINVFNGKIFLNGILNNILTDGLILNVLEDGETTVEVKHFDNALSSFNENQIIEVELKQKDSSKELFIKDDSDKTQYQTITCYDSGIVGPKEAEKYALTFKINKEMFISGGKKISFAFGVEEDRPQFFFWALRYKKDDVRFVSGMGGMFAIYEIYGKGVVDTKEKEFNIYFYNDCMPILAKILNNVSDNIVEIKETDKNEAYQIVFSTNAYKVIVVGINASISWPNEQNLLDKKNDFKFVTSLADWNYAYRGAAATYTDEMKKQEQVHRVSIHVDAKKQLVEMKSDQGLKFSRKIKIIDVESPEGINEHHCTTYSKFVQHIPDCWSKDGNVQIEFSSDPANKVLYAFYNAGDKVVEDSRALRSTNAATGLQESMTYMFVRSSVSN